MSETTVEIKEAAPSPEETAADLMEEKAEEHKEQAEEAAEEAKESAEEAKEHHEEAAEAKEEAKEAKETTEKLTSYNQSAIKGLTDSISLVVQRMEQVLGISKETAKMVEDINEELKTTLELHQEMIGTMDEAANKMVTATAALVKLHKQVAEAQN